MDQDPAAGRLDQHRLVGRRRDAARIGRQRLAAAPRPGTPAASAPPRARRDPRLDSIAASAPSAVLSRPSGALRLIVSVTGVAAIAPAASGSATRVAITPSISSGVTSGRAASWIATSSVLDRRQGVGDRLGPGRAAVDHAEVVRRRGRGRGPAGRRRRSSAPRRAARRPRSTTRPSAGRPAARRPSGRRLRASPRSRRPR